MDERLDEYKDKLIIGIDLGTTNSGVSTYNAQSDKVEMLRDVEGKTLTPSVVGWVSDDDTWLMGHAAEALAETNPTAVAYSIKRYIGRWFTAPEVLYSYRDLNYKLESGGGKDQLQDIVVNFGYDKEFKSMRQTAPQISAKVLAKLRADAAAALFLDLPAEEALEKVKYAVITVPAYFGALQRRATILAGKLAGLEVVDILNEPTAAALAYRDQVLDEDGERRILVYDLGGGTFDISLLEISADESGYLFYTRVVDGDTRLGGDDIDNSLVRWLAGQLEEQYGQQMRADDMVTRERLRHAAETAKIALSNQESYTIVLPDLDLGARAPFVAEIEITREQLEKCAAPVIERTRKIVCRAMETVANLTWEEIDEVLLVGGQTLMPAIQRSVAKLTGHPPRVIDRPQEAVSLGAGEYANILSRGQDKFEENALINVIALPLGIHLPTEERSFGCQVEANSQVPYRSAPYAVTTTENDQRRIDVRIMQGRQRDTTKAEDADLLGTLSMEILPAPKGVPKFNVEFDVQSDGTLRVLVTDVRSNQPPKSLDILETSVTVWRDQVSAEEGALPNASPPGP